MNVRRRTWADMCELAYGPHVRIYESKKKRMGTLLFHARMVCEVANCSLVGRDLVIQTTKRVVVGKCRT